MKVNKVHTRIFYFNDLHANTDNTKRLHTVSLYFKPKSDKMKTDSFTLCSGDTFVGKGKESGKVMQGLINLFNLDGMAVGNHDIDAGSKELNNRIKNSNFQYLATNIDASKSAPYKENLDKGRLIRSKVINKGGNTYGFIGATAFDMEDVLSLDTKEDIKDIDIFDKEKTFNAIQEEVGKLQDLGVNKIILISHLGFPAEKEVAQTISGIDIIIGGHTHDLVRGIQPKENYFISPTGEPVLITQAGQAGKHYGIIDVIFNEKGTITNLTNTVDDTSKVHHNMIADFVEKKLRDPIEVYGNLKTPLNLATYKSPFEEHLTSYLICDAIKEKAGADIAFHNKGCQKKNLKGAISNRDIAVALPHINTVYMYKMSEKEVVDVIKTSLNVDRKHKDKIGNLQVSGLEYTIGKNNELKNLYFVKEGTRRPINVAEPSDKVFYNVVYGSFLAGGPDRLKMLNNPKGRIKKFEWSDQEATIEFFKKLAKEGQGDIVYKPKKRVMIE